MPIQPIDLQTLFVKMNQVGREQAAAKEGIINNQEVQGKELVQQQKHQEHSVSETKETSKGPEKVHEDDQNSKGRHSSGAEDQASSDEDDKETKKNVYQDPDLGSHIDISG